MVEVFGPRARAAIAREQLRLEGGTHAGVASPRLQFATASSGILESECAALAACLQVDAAALARFTGETEILPLRRLRLGRADPHAAGPRVAELETAGGTALVFKPRSAAADRHFAAVLAALAVPSDALPEGLDLSTPPVLDCTTHSYAQALAVRDCADESAVARAWRRTGRLLALLQRLGSRDAHCANVLFTDERPTLVDCEALLQPRLRFEAAQADWPADTALGTGLLGPRGYWRAGRVLATATLGLAAEQAAGSRASLPRVEGRPVAVFGYEREVLAGYREAWLHVDARRHDLVAPRGPLAACEGLPVRLLPRPTLLYRALLTRLAKRDVDVAWLRRRLRRWPVFGVVEAPAAWIDHEVAVLGAGHVPMLTVAAQARDVGFGFADSVVVESALERAARLMRGEASPPLDWHAGLVERCLALGAATPAWQQYAGEGGPRAALARCAAVFLRHRLELPDGRLAWFGMGAAESGAALLPLLAGQRRTAAGERLRKALHAAARLLADDVLAACVARIEAQWRVTDAAAGDDGEGARGAAEPLAQVLERRRAGTPYFDPVNEHGDVAALAALCRATADAHG